MSYFASLECSVPCGAPRCDPRMPRHLCTCGAPLFARYDLRAARAWRRESLATRGRSMWRYRELMPLLEGEEPITLGGGHSPAPRPAAGRGARADPALHQGRVAQSHQFLQRARPGGGRDAGIPPRRAEPLRSLRGNAGNALAAYAAAAGLEAHVFMPKDVKVPQEDMAFEIAEQVDWQVPQWIIYPTGGGTGMVGMWKAYAELEAIGWKAPGRRPRMVSVQAEGCAPIVRAFEEGADRP